MTGASANGTGASANGKGPAKGPVADVEDPVPAALAADLDQGFVLLFDTYRHILYSTALRVTGRVEDAEDLTAEAFLRAYRALGTYDAGRIAALRARPWLVTILLNVWRNAARTAARRPQSVPLEGEGAVVVDPRASTEELATAGEHGRELALLLGRLPEDQRVAVVLRHVTGLSMVEVARALDCPEGTARSHVSRGLARLRTLQAAVATAGPGSELDGRGPDRAGGPADRAGRRSDRAGQGDRGGRGTGTQGCGQEPRLGRRDEGRGAPSEQRGGRL